MKTGFPCNEIRFFPVKIDLQGVHCKPYRVLVCSASHRPVHCKPIPCNEYRVPTMRTGVPCNENKFFPVRIYYTGKTLFWPCIDPVRDFSVGSITLINVLKLLLGPFINRCDFKNKLQTFIHKGNINESRP